MYSAKEKTLSRKCFPQLQGVLFPTSRPTKRQKAAKTRDLPTTRVGIVPPDLSRLALTGVADRLLELAGSGILLTAAKPHRTRANGSEYRRGITAQRHGPIVRSSPTRG
ncbi:hypothetical protein DPEC_G00083890 [Dallia pectoralis]|uniref:Uncharacterized protein n=1 Tax=Dallia pectoralis TaxID=75939 RepID=A0ACC2GZZ3_DALPE|nr:hypothetical protein DPEC_G00083890 [Dallia pectoralis]